MSRSPAAHHFESACAGREGQARAPVSQTNPPSMPWERGAHERGLPFDRVGVQPFYCGNVAISIVLLPRMSGSIGDSGFGVVSIRSRMLFFSVLSFCLGRHSATGQGKGHRDLHGPPPRRLQVPFAWVTQWTRGGEAAGGVVLSHLPVIVFSSGERARARLLPGPRLAPQQPTNAGTHDAVTHAPMRAALLL